MVFHERRPTGQTMTHEFHGSYKRCRFPVAFGTETVSIGHQTLYRDSWKLCQAVKVLEGILAGMCGEAERAPAMASECSSTCFNASGP
jgi:hypothetical protein